MSAATVCILGCLIGTPILHISDEASTRAAILDTLHRQAAAWNAGDIPGFMEGYVQSEDLRFASGGSIRRGWRTTLERFQSRYNSRELMGTLRFSDFEVLLISDEYAEVFGAFHLSRDDSIGDASGLFTLLMRRVNGHWLVLHDHTSAAETENAADNGEAKLPKESEEAYETPPDVQAVLDATQSELDLQASQQDSNATSTPTLPELSQQADLAFYRGDFESAVRKYKAMMSLDPRLKTSHWRLGIALFYAGQPKEGAAVFDRYHSYDNVDRENGIWRFLCHYRAFGAEEAQKQLLRYEKDDRHPFPRVYQMFEGRLSAADLVENIPEDLTPSDRDARLFYCHLYAGLYLAVQEKPDAAKRHLEQMIVNRWARSAGFGPRYMWHVGRIHYLQLCRD